MPRAVPGGTHASPAAAAVAPAVVVPPSASASGGGRRWLPPASRLPAALWGAAALRGAALRGRGSGGGRKASAEVASPPRKQRGSTAEHGDSVDFDSPGEEEIEDVAFGAATSLASIAEAAPPRNVAIAAPGAVRRSGERGPLSVHSCVEKATEDAALEAAIAASLSDAESLHGGTWAETVPVTSVSTPDRRLPASSMEQIPMAATTEFTGLEGRRDRAQHPLPPGGGPTEDADLAAAIAASLVNVRELASTAVDADDRGDLASWDSQGIPQAGGHLDGPLSQLPDGRPCAFREASRDDAAFSAAIAASLMDVQELQSGSGDAGGAMAEERSGEDVAFMVAVGASLVDVDELLGCPGATSADTGGMNAEIREDSALLAEAAEIHDGPLAHIVPVTSAHAGGSHAQEEVSGAMDAPAVDVTDKADFASTAPPERAGASLAQEVLGAPRGDLLASPTGADAGGIRLAALEGEAAGFAAVPTAAVIMSPHTILSSSEELNAGATVLMPKSSTPKGNPFGIGVYFKQEGPPSASGECFLSAMAALSPGDPPSPAESAVPPLPSREQRNRSASPSVRGGPPSGSRTSGQQWKRRCLSVDSSQAPARRSTSGRWRVPFVCRGKVPASSGASSPAPALSRQNVAGMATSYAELAVEGTSASLQLPSAQHDSVHRCQSAGPTGSRGSRWTRKLSLLSGGRRGRLPMPQQSPMHDKSSSVGRVFKDDHNQELALAESAIAAATEEVCGRMLWCSMCEAEHGAEGFCVLPCGHHFCAEALTSHLERVARGRKSEPLLCPTCRLELVDWGALLRRLPEDAQPELLGLWTRCDRSVYECPHEGCGGHVWCEDRDDLCELLCPKGHAFCALCRLGPHGGRTCEERAAEIVDRVGSQERWRATVSQEQELREDNLERKLLELGYEPQLARLAVSRSSTVSGCVLWIEQRRSSWEEELPPQRMRCAYEDIAYCGPHTADEVYIVGGHDSECANCRHAYCYDCAWRCVRGQILQDVVPCCPGSRDAATHSVLGGCGRPGDGEGDGEHAHLASGCSCGVCGRAVLSQTQLEQIMNGFFDRSPVPPTAEEVAELELESGELSYFGADGYPVVGRVSRRLQRLCFQRACRLESCVACPNMVCIGKVALPSAGWIGRVYCPVPGCPFYEQAFCSGCLRPYHFDTRCQDIPDLVGEWLRWCRSGRGEYLNHVAEHEIQYCTQLEAYNERRGRHESELRAREDNYRTLQEDEALKASRCRLCPHCGAVVEKIDGCSVMICGLNYHGGDQQSGCGRRFDWDRARQYRADIVDRRSNIPRFDAVPPSELVLVRHFISEGVPRCCDICAGAVEGPLIKCINCPDFAVCIKCDSSLDLAVEDITPGGGGAIHPAGHTFRVEVPAPELQALPPQAAPTGAPRADAFSSCLAVICAWICGGAAAASPAAPAAIATARGRE